MTYLSILTKNKVLFSVLATLTIVTELVVWESWKKLNGRKSLSIYVGKLSSNEDFSKRFPIVDQTLIKSLLTDELQTELQDRLKVATDKKIIVIWVQKFDETGPVLVEKSQCGNCEVTFDRSKVSDNRTGAVVFHFHAIDFSIMPERNPDHLHIWWNMESTSTIKHLRRMNLSLEDDYMFNSTMSFRRDSDFYQSYEFSYPGKMSTLVSENQLTPQEILKKKTKLAIAVVSNCGYTAGGQARHRLIRKIYDIGFDINLFGGCFGKEFALHWEPGLEISEEFRKEAQKYKFYFAFENSYLCKDYITGKFFNNALRSLTVPVVWGSSREDYEKVAPPGSFIYAEDFRSLEDLANYLNYLDKNDTAYLAYFRWLGMDPKDMPQFGRAIGFCHICRALHGINVDDVFNTKYDPQNPIRPLFANGVSKRSVSSLGKWLMDERRTCMNPFIRFVNNLGELRAYSLFRKAKELMNKL